MEKKARSSLILILANSRQCNSYTRQDYTRLDSTTCGYVLALDSPLCYSSACCYGSFYEAFQSCSDPNCATRSCWKKKSNKTCCCFLSVNELILHRLVSNCYDYLLTFSVMQSRLNELIASCRKLKCLEL